MKRLITNGYGISILILVTVIFFQACEDEGFPVDKSFERMFRPHTLEAIDITATQATLQWPTVSNTKLYILEVSKDSLLFQNIISKLELNADDLPSSVDGIKVTLNNLIGVSNYSARVKVTSKNGIPDSEYITVTFKTPSEQIMTPVAAADISYTSTVVHWQAGAEVTHLLLIPTGGTAQQIDLSDEEKETGTKNLTDLVPGTNYTVEIYNTAANKRGSVNFITYSLDLPDADLTVFLTETDILQQSTFDTLTATSVTFVLPQGAVYSSNTNLTLKDNVDITFFGEPGANKPIISLGSGTFVLPGVGDTIAFEGIEFSGYDYVNGVQTTTKRNYIFNQSTASSTDAVIFENCIIRNYVNTPFRLQGSNAITVDKLVFNNCIAYDCGVNTGGNGTYAFINTNVATGKINNIEITNSTLYNIGYGLILHSAAGSQSVKIENCTFDDVIGDNRYFIDYNAQTVGTFTLNKCIFGKSKSPAATARGIRIASTGATASLSYKTSDFNVTNTPINGLTDYAGASTALFTDPASGNFSFKDSNFAGKDTAGDPRWKP